ncbi:alanyl-tRNA editing protein [Natronincola ferrireducens]|uniref:Alanine--tRNA ligase n=1 Tax=Natronincola ferrireducens TaxID=393762 RepID=A0A1G9BB88_9FIRM|nr:DHHA1 domain-containing protein [Natronincola ferrireducens]SDK36842.1 alanyl-tRNA synthetase [Natronincola ferrireducens]
MKTEKLFWKDGYLKEFEGTILSVEPYKEDTNKFVVVLDKSAFYPEGGGQPWDEGKIGEYDVLYVYEEEETIYHVTDKPPIVGGKIYCTIDWGRRFDFMQQHLGQHILSGTFDKLFSAATVGFHLGKEYVTIDIHKTSLDFEEVQAVEKMANEIIYKNLQVKTLFPTKEDISTIPLRKPPKVEDGIRIVAVDGFDYSPCGGVHPTFTGEVGIIKIRKWEKNKGNIRIEFVCGQRALEDFTWKNKQINEISNLLSVKDRESEEAVIRIHEENKDLVRAFNDMKKELIAYEAKELYATAEKLGDYSVAIQQFEGKDFKDLRFLASLLVQYPNTIALLGTKIDKAQVVFSCSKDVPINMNQLFKEVAPLINGKGGGNATSAQGGGNDSPNLEGLLFAAKQKIKMEYIK